MIQVGEYWSEMTALNERAAKAEYALAYEKSNTERLLKRAADLAKEMEEIYFIAFDDRICDIANRASNALKRFNGSPSEGA